MLNNGSYIFGYVLLNYDDGNDDTNDGNDGGRNDVNTDADNGGRVMLICLCWSLE